MKLEEFLIKRLKLQQLTKNKMEIKNLIGTCFTHQSDPYFYYLITGIKNNNIIIEWIDRGGKNDNTVDYCIEDTLRYFDNGCWVAVKEPIEYYYYVHKLQTYITTHFVENTMYKVNSIGSITTANGYKPCMHIHSGNCYNYYHQDKFLPISELFVNNLLSIGVVFKRQ